MKNEKQVKRLYRSKKDKVIAGVCGGIAEYFGIDAVWIRLATVLLFLVHGFGLILYILAWILVPENSNQKESGKTIAQETVEKVKRHHSDYVYRDESKHTKKNKKENKSKKRFAENNNKKKCCKHRSIFFGILLVIIGFVLLMKNMFHWFHLHYVWPILIIAFGIYILTKRSPRSS